MPDAPILGGSGQATLDEAAFGARFHEPLVHETVRAELNARRQGTAASKNRAAVRGGSAKPWRQKGTGRARQGSTRAPHFAGGGVVFGPTPRHYTVKVNRKARRAALRSALSLHASRGSIAVLGATFDAPSTQQAAGLLEDFADARTLVVLTQDEAVIAKSFRNLPHVAVIPAEDAGVADVVGAAFLVASQGALDVLTRRATGAGEEAA